MDEFQRIFTFTKSKKTIQVKDDSLFMDIFSFFASRDLDLEATILAERELEVPSTSTVENIIVEEEIPWTTDTDEVMEGVESLPEYTIKSRNFLLGMLCKKSKRRLE